MEKKMEKKIVIFATIIFAALLFSEVSGEYGFQFLKILSGAETAGQAGTGELSSNDAFAFLENPAAGLLNRSRVLSFTQNYWLFGTKLSNIAYNNSRGKSSFGFAFRQLDYGKIEGRDEQQMLIDEFHPIDLDFVFNFAYRITPSHYFGVSVNALYEKINTSSSSGISADLGYVFLTPIRNLKLSAALKYWGITSKMNEESIQLPLTFELGTTKDFTFSSVLLSLSGKAVKTEDNNELNAALGLNCSVKEKVNFRVGYKINYDAEDFSAGIGFNLGKFIIDYAFIPFDSELDDVHMFGISYKF